MSAVASEGDASYRKIDSHRTPSWYLLCQTFLVPTWSCLFLPHRRARGADGCHKFKTL